MLKPVIGEGLSEATAEGVGYEYKGYKLLEEVMIECLGCCKNAVSLLVVKIDKSLSDCSFQVKCQTCGQLSFKKKFKNSKLYHAEVEPFNILNIDTNPDTMHTIFEVKNNES